jgi:uncharacterized DUF497 family protein
MAPIPFEWDDGNVTKSVTKHGITNLEAESVFEDINKLIGYDSRHSESELRFDCLGTSLNNRILRITFVTRSGKIRIISARNGSQKEKAKYKAQIR